MHRLDLRDPRKVSAADSESVKHLKKMNYGYVEIEVAVWKHTRTGSTG